MKTYSRKKPGDHQEVIIDLNELCRLCMAREDELVPIFNDDDAVPLTLRIMACVALEVFEGDGLPSKICHPCKYQLDKSYVFRKKCENSDQKLRQHLRELQGKLGDGDGDTEASTSDAILEESSTEPYEGEGKEVNTERDLVGVAQVSYIQPEDVEDVEEDAGHITLPVEEEEGNKEACTLATMPMKREVIEEGEGSEREGIFVVKEDGEMIELEHSQDDQTMIEDKDLDAIADAVKNILSMHPNINLTGELHMKIDQHPGKATQVQVTTEDGSVIIMELTTEDGDVKHIPSPGEVHTDEINEEGELKVFRCPDCPRSFARRVQLRRHASVHMQQRGFSCGICEKWFPTRSALVRHERIHTGERPFQCEICQKSFAQKEILFRHLMTHTGLKPYNCPHCSKGFTQKESLRVHLKTHLNANPSDIQLHYCTLCPKVFCHASGLSRHLVTHTGKTFKCRDCDKGFTDKSSLRRHHRQTNHQE